MRGVFGDDETVVDEILTLEAMENAVDRLFWYREDWGLEAAIVFDEP